MTNYSVLIADWMFLCQSDPRHHKWYTIRTRTVMIIGAEVLISIIEPECELSLSVSQGQGPMRIPWTLLFMREKYYRDATRG